MSSERTDSVLVCHILNEAIKYGTNSRAGCMSDMRIIWQPGQLGYDNVKLVAEIIERTIWISFITEELPNGIGIDDYT